ncbi:MAG: hypothetical protein ABJE10_19695 [bacterium]
MSTQFANTQFAEATIPELELNKETLQDLEVDGSQVKGGAGYVAVAGPAPQNPGTIRMTIGTSGTSVIHGGLNPSGG